MTVLDHMTALPSTPRRSFSSLDEDELLDRIEGDDELLVDLAQTFINVHGTQVGALRKALNSNDFGALGRAAHMLKGALSTLAAHATVHAAAIEMSARSSDRAACEIGVSAIENEVTMLVADLQTIVHDRTG